MKKQDRSDRSVTHSIPIIAADPRIQAIIETLGTQISQLIMSSLSEMLLLTAEIKNQSAIYPEVPKACPLLSAGDRHGKRFENQQNKSLSDHTEERNTFCFDQQNRENPPGGFGSIYPSTHCTVMISNRLL
jgi:hypothetical protein